RGMLDALVAGTTDAAILAELAKGRLRAKLPELREALEGRFESAGITRHGEGDERPLYRRSSDPRWP
ncbi:MAG: hypothetical protein LC790_13680, partial [Actinobacteria bacterium]|nr:hypothetical protein [Actinomycetota bacterium]